MIDGVGTNDVRERLVNVKVDLRMDGQVETHELPELLILESKLVGKVS